MRKHKSLGLSLSGFFDAFYVISFKTKDIKGRGREEHTAFSVFSVFSRFSWFSVFSLFSVFSVFSQT